MFVFGLLVLAFVFAYGTLPTSRRLGGRVRQDDPTGKSVSVSCSCRACVRAGEAKLRGRVRQGIPNAGENPAEMCSGCCGSGGRFRLFIFVAIRMGFKVIFSRSMLYALVLANMLEIIELSMLFAWVLRFFRFFLGDINAICMGFKVILRSV